MEVLTSEQELQLVKQAQTEISAFERLYEFYLPKLYNYAFYRTGNRQEAEDVVSLTFIKALEYLKKVKQNALPSRIGYIRCVQISS